MKKFLIIRFSSIGDIVLTTPVIRCLKKHFKDKAEIHCITKKQYTFLYESNPNVSKVVSIDKSINEVIDVLKNEEYDFIIDLHNNVRTASLKKKLRVKSYTFKKHNIQKWMLCNLGIDRLPGVHIVDRYFETISHFGIENDNNGLDYFIPNDIALESDFSDKIAFVIGGQHEGKKMPNHQIIELIKLLNSKVVLIGGKEDEKAGLIIEKACEKAKSYCGKLNLNESALAVKQSKVVIAHDTGLMHIASAFKKDIISLWGQTTPRFGMYPYLPGKDSKIIEPKAKRTLSKLGNKKTKKHAMQSIDLVELSTFINKLT